LFLVVEHSSQWPVGRRELARNHEFASRLC
jgi:hypothetical protein